MRRSGKGVSRVTCTEEPDGGNLHVRIWEGPGVAIGRGYSTMVFLRLARRRRPPLVRSDQRPRRLVGQESQSAEYGPPDRKTGGVGGTGDSVFHPARRERARSVRRQWFDHDR